MTSPAELLSRYTAQSEMSSFFIDKMGLISVKSYGAIGDGVTNDTATITAAKTAATAAGLKGLFFPHGTYLVDAGTTFTGFYLWGDNSAFSGISDTIAQVGDFANAVYLQVDEPINSNPTTLWFDIEGDINFSQGDVIIGNAETSDTPPDTFYWFQPI